jgi:hypothetical protein
MTTYGNKQAISLTPVWIICGEEHIESRDVKADVEKARKKWGPGWLERLSGDEYVWRLERLA